MPESSTYSICHSPELIRVLLISRNESFTQQIQSRVTGWREEVTACPCPIQLTCYTNVADALEQMQVVPNVQDPVHVVVVESLVGTNGKDDLAIMEQILQADDQVQLIWSTPVLPLPSRLVAEIQRYTDRMIQVKTPGDWGAFWSAVLAQGCRSHLLRQLERQSQQLECTRKNLAASNAQLLDAMQAARVADEAHAHFYAIMSHEIRTPLNGIIGMLELLEDTRLTSIQRDYLRDLRRCGSVLESLVDQVMDYANLQAGQLRLACVNFEVRPCLSRMMKPIKQRAADAGLVFEQKIDEQVPEQIKGDPDRFCQLAWNLLDNAIKFTPEGGHIGLSLKVERGDGDQMTLMMEVTDTGVGIADMYLPSLFEGFTQIDNLHTRSAGGAGLGLALCKQLSRLMGGDIKVQTQLGVGSTFTVRLPLASVTALEPRKLLERPRILLVEDSVINQRVATAMLKKLYCQVEVVSDGPEGIEAFATHDYQMVLLDYRLPAMDGTEVAVAMRRLESCGRKPTPLLAMTAETSPQIKIACSQAGMNSYITKPISISAMRKILQKWIPDYDQRVKDVQASEKQAAEKTLKLSESQPLLEEAVVRKLRATPMNGAMREQLELFLNESVDRFCHLLTLTATGCQDQIPAEIQQMENACYQVGASRMGGLCADMRKEPHPLSSDQVMAFVEHFAEELEKIRQLVKGTVSCGPLATLPGDLSRKVSA